MSVKIRLKRLGNRHRAFFRLVVADSRSPRDGRFIEELGYYDPLRATDQYSIKRERALYWLKQGAQLSETARSLLKKTGVFAEWKAWREAQKRGASAGLPSEPAGPLSAEEEIARAAAAVRASQGNAPGTEPAGS